jgi:hypothetical protein
MNWWEWVFSGVGVLALGLLIGWLRRPARPSGPAAAITAQGAKVSDSPIASGSGVTQNIGDTHNYYYPPVAVPPPAIDPAQAAEIKPARHRPNLKFAGGKKISLRTEPGDIFRQSLPRLAHGEAVVVSVTNDALPDAPNAGAIVKATLFYRDGEQELLRGMGCWLDEGSGMVEFHVDDLHSVILGSNNGERCNNRYDCDFRFGVRSPNRDARKYAGCSGLGYGGIIGNIRPPGRNDRAFARSGTFYGWKALSGSRPSSEWRRCCRC